MLVLLSACRCTLLRLPPTALFCARQPSQLHRPELSEPAERVNGIVARLPKDNELIPYYINVVRPKLEKFRAGSGSGAGTWERATGGSHTGVGSRTPAAAACGWTASQSLLRAAARMVDRPAARD